MGKCSKGKRVRLDVCVHFDSTIGSKPIIAASHVADLGTLIGFLGNQRALLGTSSKRFGEDEGSQQHPQDSQWKEAATAAGLLQPITCAMTANQAWVA